MTLSQLMTAEGRVFVDTNILIYARDASEPTKQPIAQELVRALWRARRGRLSLQVLQEYYVTVTQKIKPGRPINLARNDVRHLTTWQPVVPDALLLETAWGFQDRYALSWWDSLIIAAAERAGAPTLVTEDMQHGMRYGRVEVVDPFQAA